jgi:hypothetical protein
MDFRRLRRFYRHFLFILYYISFVLSIFNAEILDILVIMWYNMLLTIEKDTLRSEFTGSTRTCKHCTLT